MAKPKCSDCAQRKLKLQRQNQSAVKTIKRRVKSQSNVISNNKSLFKTS